MSVDPMTIVMLAKLVADSGRLLHDALQGNEPTDAELDALRLKSEETHKAVQESIRESKARQ